MRRAWPIAAVLALALAAAGVARGELAQDGNLQVAVDGNISPNTLPRTGTAPVGINIETTVRTTDGSDPPPQLQRIAIAINREGKIFDRGLPTCGLGRIKEASIEGARQSCGGAIVGNGRVRVRVNFENQPPFTVRAPLIVFNAKRLNGERRLVAQMYSRRPPDSFLLTFRVRRTAGEFGNVVEARLSPGARRWAYVTHFQMKLRRVYDYRGRQRSFINAGCPAPKGVPGVLYNFARSTFVFGDDRRISNILVRDCKVR